MYSFSLDLSPHKESKEMIPNIHWIPTVFQALYEALGWSPKNGYPSQKEKDFQEMWS